MERRFPRLFEPIQIGKVRIKNRIAMAPMGFPMLQDFAGIPTQRYVDYFSERARGGAGLLITGMLKVEDQLENLTPRRGPVKKEFIRPFADLTETVHSLGTKIFAQISAGFGYQANPANVEKTPISASAIPNFVDPKVTCRALTTAEVEGLVKAFGDAAEILAIAGVDGVEVHGHEGFLIDQFTTALWNKRDDKYGGDLKGRLTFPLEILREIKRRIGDQFPVQYRFGLRHYMKASNAAAVPGETFVEVGRDIEEGLAMARMLEEAGFDALAVDAGCATGHYWSHPPMYQKHGCLLDMAAMVKKLVNIPVLTVGRLDLPEMAEKAIEEGKADMIALAKGLLADPYWPNKVLEGRVEDIRPCIGCHEACSGILHGRQVNSCAVNPACGRERAYELKPAEKAKKVLIVGGGIAGMEAARVATIRGHKVTLYEKEETLGGHLIEASVPDDKKDIERLNRWYQRELKNLGVDIRLKTEVTLGLIKKGNPDVVIVASGSQSCIPNIPGIGKHQVMTSIDMLLGTKETGESVVVIGAGEIGCETALWLASKGKKVRVVEMLSQPLSVPIARANRNMLLDMLAFHQVPILTDTTLREVLDDAILVSEKQGDTRRIDCDTVVLAVGLKADAQLYQSLAGRYPRLLYAIGDCREPKNIMTAVWDGFEVGRTI
jgi:2-enoate reductase